MSKYKYTEGAVCAALSKSYGNRDPKLIVKSFAIDLLITCKLIGPPYSPFDYARALNLKVEFEDIEADGVFIDCLDNGPRIVLRKHIGYLSQMVQRRMNFTLAHEIGHYLIRNSLVGSIPVSKFRKTNSKGQKQFNTDIGEERLCDIFASELLMPKDVIINDLGNTKLSPNIIFALADRYEVSLTALLRRITQLANGSFAAVIWTKKDEHYSVSWSTPYRFQDLILCDTGKTTVERASETINPLSGTDQMYLNGQRMRWLSISQQLPSSSKILTLMIRASKCPFKLEINKEPIAAPISLGFTVPTQLSLPFEPPENTNGNEKARHKKIQKENKENPRLFK